jgi:hypothetical protein
VASILCMPMTYWLGRELSGKAQAFAGALLFTLWPMSLYFAQETRVYAVFMLAASGMLWAAAVFQRDARSVKAAMLYCVFGTFCLYLHATGLLLVAACGGAVWLSLLTQGATGRRALLPWTALNGFVLLLGVPYLLHILAPSHSGGLDWMPRAGIHQLVYCTTQVVSGVLTPYPWPGLPLAVAVIAALAVSLGLRRPSRRAIVTLLGVPCLYLVLVLVVSVGRPILLPRILAWTVVPLCVLAGRQLVSSGRARVAVILTLVLASGIGLFFQVTTLGSNKEPWRDIIRTVGPRLQQADLVVLSPLADPMVLTYYAPQVKNVRLWDASLPPSIMNEAAERLHIQPISGTEIQQAIDSKHSVWIVAHSFDSARVNALRSRVPSTYFQVWSCGKVPCVVVAAWQPQPNADAANRAPDRQLLGAEIMPGR